MPAPIDSNEVVAENVSAAVEGVSIGRDPPPPGRIPLKLMSYNTWQSGKNVNDGFNKMVEHIRLSDPDIVALQELQTPMDVNRMAELLGSPWMGMSHAVRDYPDTGILTKHNISNATAPIHVGWGMGITILVGEGATPVHVFCMHLNYKSFPMYAAHNKLVTREEQLYLGEHTAAGDGRVQNMQELVDHKEFRRLLKQAGSGDPLIVMGDFNTPSHQDWIEENKAIHGGWAYEWPTTKLLTSNGLTDSFRELHPNVTAEPGITWSTIQKAEGPEWEYSIPEPQDRIDYIFYRGKKLVPLKSYPYAGEHPEALVPIPHHQDNYYSSDHFSLITEFDLGVGK